MVATHLTDLRGEARALDDAFVACANAGDMAGLVEAYYAEDARLLPPHHPMVEGKAAILEFWKGLGPAVIEVGLDTPVVESSGDLGYGVGTATLVLRGPDGQPVHDTAKYLLTYRRQADGAWKVIADMWSPNA
ncbi:MAG: DUF4440 domain-containing protein [Chloroflexota bacterium]